MRGRKPVPTVLKIARGNPGQHKIRDDEPRPAAVVDLTAPTLVADQPDAKAAWDDQAPRLQRLGVFTEADRDALILYCVTFARWQHAERELRASGMVVAYRKSKAAIVSPYVAIAAQLATQCRALLNDFGLTPVARARVHVPKDAAGDGKKDRFFGVSARTKPA